MSIILQNILKKLDVYFAQNDYISAEKHLLHWIDEAKILNDQRNQIALYNELAGLYRKLGKKQNALDTVETLLNLIKVMGIEQNIGAGTTYINCATVYKAFGMASEALPLFEMAQNIYEKELPHNDKRFGGLYNNMALALVDLKRFDEAYALYNKAILVMKTIIDGELEVAITYLNIASAKESELGLENSQKIIDELLNKSMQILDMHQNKNGYYAFVCEKCASVFGYYGYFAYENELLARAREIYERS